MLKQPPNYWIKGKSLEYPKGNEAASIYCHRITGMVVMRSVSTMKDGSDWVHISVSRKDRLPSWEELKKVKEEFLGDLFEAFHAIPKSDDFVNLHIYCIHLWSPLSKIELPNLKNIINEKAI